MNAFIPKTLKTVPVAKRRQIEHVRSVLLFNAVDRPVAGPTPDNTRHPPRDGPHDNIINHIPNEQTEPVVCFVWNERRARNNAFLKMRRALVSVHPGRRRWLDRVLTPDSFVLKRRLDNPTVASCALSCLRVLARVYAPNPKKIAARNAHVWVRTSFCLGL